MSAPVHQDQTTGGDQSRLPSSALSRRTKTLLVAAFGVVMVLSLVSLVPLPYAIMAPGPVRDTLGDVGGAPLIAIPGQETYPTDGRLQLTTVSVYGGPGSDVDVTDLVRAWLDPAEVVLPVDQVIPPDQDEEELEQRNAEEMVSSQENATAAAMTELDITVPTTMTVVGFSPESDAAEELATGDVVLAVEGDPVPDLPQLRDRLQDVEPGEPVTVSVERDGEPLEVEVVTLEGPDGQTLLGVFIDPEYEFPFEVAIQIERIGGPSAGLMFALGIVDKLTPGAMTGGESVAGTGTIDSSGLVGPIGGIRQKLVGAQRDGAEYFLAPADNCDEVVGHVPDGLQVVRVETLGDAREAVESIGEGDTEGLPACA